MPKSLSGVSRSSLLATWLIPRPMAIVISCWFILTSLQSCPRETAVIEGFCTILVGFRRSMDVDHVHKRILQNLDLLRSIGKGIYQSLEDCYIFCHLVCTTRSFRAITLHPRSAACSMPGRLNLLAKVTLHKRKYCASQTCES